MATKYNINIDQGAGWELKLTWKDKNGVPIDLTSATAKMQIRQGVSSEQVTVNMSTETGEIILNESLGGILLTLDSEKTSSLRKTSYVYDLFITRFGVEPYKLIEGVINVSLAVTR